MNITEKDKNEIDKMSFSYMLRLRRFAAVGHRYFKCGELNDYFVKVFSEKRDRITCDEYAAISKDVGWD